MIIRLAKTLIKNKLIIEKNNENYMFLTSHSHVTSINSEKHCHVTNHPCHVTSFHVHVTSPPPPEKENFEVKKCTSIRRYKRTVPSTCSYCRTAFADVGPEVKNHH